MKIKVTTDTVMGRFTYEVGLNPDKKRFDVTPIEPSGGHGGVGSYTERLKKLLGRNYEGNREMQAFTEAILLGCHACFFTLCNSTAICALADGEPMGEYDLKQCGHEENIESFKQGVAYLYSYLRDEVANR